MKPYPLTRKEIKQAEKRVKGGACLTTVARDLRVTWQKLEKAIRNGLPNYAVGMKTKNA